MLKEEFGFEALSREVKVKLPESSPFFRNPMVLEQDKAVPKPQDSYNPQNGLWQRDTKPQGRCREKQSR